MDGVLDEAAWAQAEPIEGFIQNRPHIGAPASERTVVRILYDSKHLYVGAMLFDSQPDRITAYSMKRDYPSGDEDTFGIILGTFLDRRSGFLFGVNPLGAIRTGQVSDDGRDVNFSWQPVFHWKSVIHAEGWAVELAIPFASLRFDSRLDEQVWGLNMVRRLKRNDEDAYWAPLDRRFTLNRISDAGTLRGIRGISDGLDLAVKPFVRASQSDRTQQATERGGEALDGGVDVKYGISRQITLDLTYRTDFSQVEVDEEALNLTPYSLFFPDKRDFFIENSGIFQFGDVVDPTYRIAASQDFKLFHSRRVGLVESRSVPVLGGARLTGRAGGWEFGMLDMQTDAIEGVPRENMSVVRARTNSPGRIQLGAMALRRHSDVRDNMSFGTDINARPLKHLWIHSYLATGTSGRPTTRDGTGRIAIGWRDPTWNAGATYRYVGPDFDPALGFVRRLDVRQSSATLGGHFTPVRKLTFQEVNPWMEVNYVTSTASVLQTRITALGVDADFKRGDSFDVSVNDNFERVVRPFTIVSATSILPGDYSFLSVGAQFQSNRKRMLSGKTRVTTGGFYGGRRTSLEAEGRWKPSPHMSLQVMGQRHAIHLAGQNHLAAVLGSRLEVVYSTHLLGSVFIQYNGVTDERITNVRVNLIHAPLSDVFLVLTDRRADGGRTALPERQAIVKVTRLMSW